MADPIGTTDSPSAEPSPAMLQRQQLLAQALKDKVPLAALDPTSGTYDDLDSAAQAFYAGIGPHDIKSEEAGLLYSDADGKYHYSIPTAQQDDSFRLRAQQSAAQKLAGIFHTHPGADRDGQVFSPNDVAAANQLKVPSYIYFENAHDLRKFVPGVSKTHPMTIAGRIGERVADGDPVAKQQLIAQALRE